MADTYQINTRSRSLALLFTLLIGGFVTAVLLLIILHTPIPPYPEGGGGKGSGIELNLGISDASPLVSPKENVLPDNSKPEPQVKPDNEKVLTQETEDAPALNDKDSKTPKSKKIPPKKSIVPVTKVPEKQPVQQQQVVNSKAMYHPTKNQPLNNNNVTGNQGNPNGNLGAKAFAGQGGKEGTGGGSGGGQGTGSGTNTGPTASANLQERNPVLPIPVYNQQVEGIVVVSVTVNSDGEVVEATPGVKGSTTLEPSLLDAAQQAAFKAHFDQKPGSLREKGTIRYHFRLQ